MALTWPGRRWVEGGSMERKPGPTMSASLHSTTEPSPSSLTLNFFSMCARLSAAWRMAATTPGRHKPSTHSTVTLAPIIDLFGILLHVAIPRRPRAPAGAA